MIKKICLFLLILLPLVVSAEGPYVRAFAGLNNNGDTDFSTSNGSDFINADIDFDSGYLAGIAVGYRFLPNIDIEIEYARRQSDVGNVMTEGDRVNIDGTGKLTGESLMLNTLFYFNFLTNLINPYVGVGVGFMTDMEIESGIVEFGREHTLDDAAFAFQGIIGLELYLKVVSLFIEGRVMSASSPDLISDNSSFNLNYDNYDILAGATFHF